MNPASLEGKTDMISRVLCLVGRHEWWVRARLGVCRAEEQCAVCGATRLCMGLNELITHKGDIVWYDSTVIRKAEQE